MYIYCINYFCNSIAQDKCGRTTNVEVGKFIKEKTKRDFLFQGTIKARPVAKIIAKTRDAEPDLEIVKAEEENQVRFSGVAGGE